MRWVAVVAAGLMLTGCPGRGRPRLEPEETITKTWVGAAPPPAQEAAPAPTAPPEHTEHDPPPPEATRVPAPAPDPKPAEAAAPRRGGWVRGGSWDR